MNTTRDESSGQKRNPRSTREQSDVVRAKSAGAVRGLTGSLRFRLLVLLTLVFCVVLLAATYAALDRREADKRYTRNQLLNEAHFIAERQSDAIRRTGRFVEFMTTVIGVSSLAQDPDCAAKLRTYMSNDRYLTNVFIADDKGNAICNPLVQSGRLYVGDRGYFTKALKSSDAVIGAPVLGRFSNRWVLPFARRQEVDHANAKGIYVLVVALDLNWVNEAFEQISKERGMRLGLVTSSGLVLVRQPDPGTWIGRNISGFPGFAKLKEVGGDGTAEVVSHDGQTRIYVFAPFARTDEGTIYLWMTVPMEVATARADQQFALQLTLLCSLLGTTFLLAWFGGHRLLVSPVEAIVGAAHRLARGDSEARTGIPHSNNELGQLARAFDDMACQLGRLDVGTGLLNLKSFTQSLDLLLTELGGRDACAALIRMHVVDLPLIEARIGVSASLDLVKRLAAELQFTAGAGALLARAGDGGFVLATSEASDPVAIMRITKRLTVGLLEPLGTLRRMLPDTELCFGIALFPLDGLSARVLVQHAGLALTVAQRDRSSRIRFYAQEMDERVSKRARHRVALQQAILEGALELHYQPQVELATGRLLGFEALVRWNHPDEGWISPGEFIPLAEESGLIVPLGDWVLRRATIQLAEWIHLHPALSGLVMAVNISAAQIKAGDFCDKVRLAMETAGIAPAALELEITESQLMTSSSEPLLLIQRLRGLGVLLAIDDFGTGYSSLAYLKHISADRLKIDKTFVDHLETDGDDVAIVEATIAMAHKLGMCVIAEGVETAGQAKALKRLGCDQIQGYYIGRPTPPAKALAFACDFLKIA